ncbi:MAG: hypothetical protein MR552_06635 [Clostridiales bacterium]|nr:hypothetical protein [Clostridiales bacterium]
MMKETQLEAWAQSELARATQRVSQISDVGSKRYEHALSAVSTLRCFVENEDPLNAWAQTERERVAKCVSQIDDVGSKRYEKALDALMQLRFFANPKIPDADYDWPPTDDAPAAPAAEAPGTPAEEPTPEPEPEAAPEPEPEPTYTLPQVRTKLAEAKRKGIALPELFQEFGASSIMSVPSTDYGALMARVAELLESVE